MFLFTLNGLDLNSNVEALQDGPGWDGAALNCFTHRKYPSTPTNAMLFRDKKGPTWTGVLRSKAIFRNTHISEGTRRIRVISYI